MAVVDRIIQSHGSPMSDVKFQIKAERFELHSQTGSHTSRSHCFYFVPHSYFVLFVCYLVRIRADQVGFPPLFGRPLFDDDLFFTALLFTLFLVRLLAVAVRVIGGQSIASSLASPSGGSPTTTAHFRLVICVQQRKQVTKLFLLRVIANLLHLLQRLLHTFMGKDFNLCRLLLTIWIDTQKETVHQIKHLTSSVKDDYFLSANWPLGMSSAFPCASSSIQ